MSTFSERPPANKERKEFVMRSRLHIFRHGKKAGENNVTQEEDLVMELTPQGKADSMKAGEQMETLEGAWSLAVGSPRLRARETAAFTRAAHHPEVTGDESLSELHDKIGETGPYSGTWSDPRLDMPFIKGVTPHFDELLVAYEEKRYLRELIALYNAAPEKDKFESTYATQVRGIAELVARHMRLNEEIGKRHDYYGAGSQNNPEVPEAVERFFGTHGGVTESFLVEVVRRVRGEEAMNELLDAIPNGMAYNDGIVIDIQTVPHTAPVIHLRFSLGPSDHPYVFDEDVPAEVIKEMVHDFSQKGD